MGAPGPPSSSRTTAISRFLAKHQDHDAGFDVGREAGSGTGRLRIVCLGCGESIEYRAGEAAEIPPEIPADPRARRSSPRERPRRSKAADRGTGGPFGKHPFAAKAIGILIAAALLLAAILLLTDSGSETPKNSTPTTPTSVSVATEPAAPATPPPAQPQGQPRPPRLHPATFADRFRIGVPGAWHSEMRDTETVLSGPGGTPEIDVYYALDSRGLDELGSDAVGFLEDRHPAGKVADPGPTRVGDLSGLQVVATYPDGSETAVVLTSGGYAYLLIKRVDRRDEPFRVRQATSSVDSFRPL
jgi:hypothetical protein